MDQAALLVGLLVVAGTVAALWGRERRARARLQREVNRANEELAHITAGLNRARDRLQAVLDSDDSAVLLINRESRIVLTNQAAEDLFGEPEQAAGLISFTRSVELESLASEAAGLPAGQAVERQISLSGRPYRARANAHPDVISLWLRDVSELRRLSRARRDLIGNLSHELRTPLTSLRLLAETFAGPGSSDPELAASLAEKMTAEVDMLQQMTQEMLDLAAIESGRQVVRLVSVRLGEVVREPVERLADQAERNQVTLSRSIDPGLAVLADPEQARRAIVNVLHNAIKFAEPGGQVSLTAERESDSGRILLHIADDGPGIRPDELDRIFERFYRSEATRGTPGTGLGLAIARNIMQAHGGSIWADNRRPPDSGAVITLAFVPA